MSDTRKKTDKKTGGSPSNARYNLTKKWEVNKAKHIAKAKKAAAKKAEVQFRKTPRGTARALRRAPLQKCSAV